MNIEEGHPNNESGLKHWYQRHKILVIVLGVGLGVLITIGIILAIVFSVTGKKDSDPTTTSTTSVTTKPVVPSDPNSRVDCVPWLKLKNNVDELIKECAKYDYCSYHSVDNNKQVPSCYYEKDKITYQVLSNQATSLGFSVMIQKRNSQNSNLKIDFELLDDNTLRFKVI